jgi:hypothetical protein
MTFWGFVFAYITARILFENVIPILLDLLDTYVEGSKFFKKKPSKYDNFIK